MGPIGSVLIDAATSRGAFARSEAPRIPIGVEMKPSLCIGRAVLGVLAMGILACQKAGEVKKEVATDVKAGEVKSTAIDAYMYAYPLVTMELTRRVLTNVATAGTSTAPMGQWAKLRSYPTPEFKKVTAPNADTYYTIIWLDVSK
jgi:hypothetical protein